MSSSAFSKFLPYSRRLQRLALRGSPGKSRKEWSSICNPALNGEPARTLRQQIPLAARRSAGAFFTGSVLARRLLRKAKLSTRSPIVVIDPTSGAGDLLLAAARRLPLGKSLQETIQRWSRTLQGLDLQPEFVAAARARLLLLARQRHGVSHSTEVHWPAAFPLIRAGDALRDKSLYRHADFILLNPPFSPTPARAACEWASGNVNSAAVFLEHVLNCVLPGTRILAILPEVLRTGTRYAKWRSLISQRAERLAIESCGIFDNSADVDVFFLVLKTRPKICPGASANWLGRNSQPGSTVSDRFSITVGPVVPYRAPHTGPRRRYVHPRNVPAWKVVRRTAETRRFDGAVFKPPFVVIRRTSRPGDKFRAVAAEVHGTKPVAVENHLIVCTPKDGTIKQCRLLIKALRRQQTNRFLNNHIRCRHLTVRAIEEIPLAKR
jgi:hypothetical protein